MGLLCRIFTGIAVVISGCGDLSEQQANHQKLREGLKKHQVKRVTENEILTAAFAKGDTLIAQLNTGSPQPAYYWTQGAGSALLDSVIRANNDLALRFIPWRAEHKTSTSELEQQLLDAYVYSYEQGQSLANNVQLLEDQQILYTAPLIFEDALQGIWSIRLKRSDIVLDFD